MLQQKTKDRVARFFGFWSIFSNFCIYPIYMTNMSLDGKAI